MQSWPPKCLVDPLPAPCPPLLPAPQDLSSNGTFLNGELVGKGRSVPLAAGDRISLVLSVSPLAEQAWLFHTGGAGLAAWLTAGWLAG